MLETGIFQAQSGDVPDGHSSFGPITKVWDALLVQSTTTIPARKSLRFGLRYVINGAPAGAKVEIKFITHFPEAGLLDPVTGIRHYESEYTAQRVIGALPTANSGLTDHGRSYLESGPSNFGMRVVRSERRNFA